MSEQIEQYEVELEPAAACDVVPSERGMTTAEYAIGVVLVITVVGVVIKLIQNSWFTGLVKPLVEGLFDIIKTAMGG